VHQQVNFLVHRDRHFRGHDVVFGVLIVRGIDTEKVRVGLVDLVGMDGAELAIRAGVAEIKSKLSRLHLNRHGIAAGGVRYTLAHAFTPNTPKARHSVPTSRKAAITNPAAPPGKLLILSPGLGLENFQMKKASRTARRGTKFPPPHRVACTARRSDAVDGDILWQRPRVHDNGNCRSNCDQHNDRTAKIFAISPAFGRINPAYVGIAAASDCGDSLICATTAI
jgi:hypothetical protein